MRQLLMLCFLFLSFSQYTLAQAKLPTKAVSGPIIKKFGDTYDVKKPDVAIHTDVDYKVVFDIAKANDDTNKVNRYFNTVARFINMHARAGIPKEQLKPVMVVHGTAAYDLLNNKAYLEKFGHKNPNIPLLDELHKAGIPIILCGQTASSRAITLDKRYKNTQIALSAMTALTVLQQQGYSLIAF